MARLSKETKYPMAAKKSSGKQTAKKSSVKRATASAKKTARKVARGGKSLAKKAASAASRVSRKTKQVAQGAQKVGRVMGVIGDLVVAGGKAAEDLTDEVESSGRRALARSRKASGAVKNSTPKKKR